MSLIPWKNKTADAPAGGALGLTELRSEMNRLFDSFLREPFGSLTDSLSNWGRWAPNLDVAESNTALVVRAELPGVDPKDIDITVTGDRLTISGEKRETVERKDQDLHQRESRYGSFSRSLQLPSSVDAQRVSADYVNGVLSVTLQKIPAATPKKIPVKSAGRSAP